MGRTSPFQIELSAGERQSLEHVARRHTSAFRDVLRARIVLAAAQGLTNEEIGQRLSVSRDVVSQWRKRFFEFRLNGLDDAGRSGRPARFSPRHRRGGESARVPASP